jgi:hypothetical protein
MGMNGNHVPPSMLTEAIKWLRESPSQEGKLQAIKNAAEGLALLDGDITGKIDHLHDVAVDVRWNKARRSTQGQRKLKIQRPNAEAKSQCRPGLF